MRRAFLIFSLFAAVCAFGGAASPFAGMSYIQRGILEYGGAEIPLTVYVARNGNAVDMAVESDAGTLAKVSVSADDGRELECVGGAILPERLVRRFVLRDLRVALGLGGFDGSAVVVRRVADGKTVSVSTDGYAMEFSDYKKIGGICVPSRIEISDKNYRLGLDFVGEIKRR